MSNSLSNFNHVCNTHTHTYLYFSYYLGQVTRLSYCYVILLFFFVCFKLPKKKSVHYKTEDQHGINKFMKSINRIFHYTILFVGFYLLNNYFSRFEGVATLMQGRGKMQVVLVIVLSDVLFFLLENNHKYSFFTPDNKVFLEHQTKLFNYFNIIFNLLEV